MRRRVRRPSPTVYQVPLSYRGTRLPGGDDALVGTLEDATSGTRYVYDGPHDPVFAEVLLQSMLAETSVGSADPDGATRARGHRQPGEPRPTGSSASRGAAAASSPTRRSSTTPRPATAAKPLIFKVFRVLHGWRQPRRRRAVGPGRRRLDAVPRPFGHVSGGGPTAPARRHVHGHLAFAQEFLPGVEDAWRVAADAVGAG